MKTEDLRIAKDGRRAHLRLTCGAQQRGDFFVSPQLATGPWPERVFDVLNDRDRRFLPWRDGETGEVGLINRDHIVTAEYDDEHFPHPDLPDATVPAELAHVVVDVDGVDEPIEGLLFTGHLPPDRRRVADVLNAGDRFVLLRTGARVTAVALDHVREVRS